jgi:hypothetical protein
MLPPRFSNRNGGIGDRRLGRARREDALQRMQHELVDRARIAEAHLDLRRMDVDIHAARVDLEEQHVGRLAVAVQELGVGLARRVPEEAIAHETSVDEEVLRVGARARRLRRAGEAEEAQRAALRVDRDARLDELRAQDGAHPLAERLAAQVPAHPAVVLEGEGDGGLRERDAAEHFVAVAELGRLGAQELAPRRRVEVEILHRDRGARRARGGLDLAQRRSFRLQRAAMGEAARARGDR